MTSTSKTPLLGLAVNVMDSNVNMLRAGVVGTKLKILTTDFQSAAL